MESLSKRMNMKTLDEVIEELQYWDTCNEYPECFYDDEVTRDALNYLKEYKRVQNKIEKIALGNIEDTLDKLDNKPLTWDELKTMEGKPVWVETESINGWVIVEIRDSFMKGREYIKFGLLELSNKDLGKTWQVYKKERDEDLRRSDKEVRNV